MDGYDPDRMISTAGQFECVICSFITYDPQECDECGSLTCKKCIDEWQIKCVKSNNKPTCPACRVVLNFSPIKGALKKMFLSLVIKCQNYSKCKKSVEIYNLNAHESVCMNLKKSAIIENLVWDKNAIGSKMEISKNDTVIKLSESQFQFRSALANKGFTEGIHYWEIEADPMTENEMKIGVNLVKNFDYNKCFCDFEFGYAFYGIAQTRHGSNSNGLSYGRKWKKEGVIGVLLNMDKGTVKFCYDGEDMGTTFTDPKLQKGPIYPAISLLHEAGGALLQNVSLPKCYQSEVE